jgi:hypothetical protein
VNLLIGWLQFVVVFAGVLGGAAIGAGIYEWIGTRTSHVGRLTLSVIVGGVSGLVIATPYLVTIAVPLAPFCDQSSTATKTTYWRASLIA